MNWLSDILPGIKRKKRSQVERTVPEGVWTKCEQCNSAIYSPELEKNCWVCPSCDYHQRISAEKRAQILLDVKPTVEEIAAGVRSQDMLKFNDGQSYEERLQKAQGDDARRESVRVYRGAINGTPVVTVIFDFSFMGGSLGSVAGERFVRGVEEAQKTRVPFITIASSGGARMQEGVMALFQMAKATAALSRLSRYRLPHISVLADPTTGGVAASFAMIADIVIAEPKALIGFAGPRVVQETVREKLPDGFQRSEFLSMRGAVDMIWDRREMRDKFGVLLPMLLAK